MENANFAVPCDVANPDQVENIAQAALERFGRIDTWVNDAGVSIYRKMEEVSEDDARKLFETNFCSMKNGHAIRKGRSSAPANWSEFRAGSTARGGRQRRQKKSKGRAR